MKKLILPAICILPVAGVAIWFVSGKNPGNAALIGLMLACPLSHMFLMKHHGKGGDRHGQK